MFECESDVRNVKLTVLAFAFEDFFVVLHERDLRFHAGKVLVCWLEVSGSVTGCTV